MGAVEFGQYVDRVRTQRGWSLARVAVGIGVLHNGRALNESQVKRILEGRRSLDREIVDRLVDALGLDPFEAYEVADLRPEGFTAADHRSFAFAGQAGEMNGHAAAPSTGSNPTPSHNLYLLRHTGDALAIAA